MSKNNKKKPVVKHNGKNAMKTAPETRHKLIVGKRKDNVYTGVFDGKDDQSLLAVALTDKDWRGLTDTADDLQSIVDDSSRYQVLAVAKAQGDEPQPTNQNISVAYQVVGVPHPIDYISVKTFKDVSPHHSACIQAKKNATTGLGFVSDGSAQEQADNANVSAEDVAVKVGQLLTGEAYISTEVDKILNPLCMESFQQELSPITEDFFDTGTGYLEVVRDDSDKIVGLNWLPVQDLYVYLVQDKESHRNFMFYRYVYSSGNAYNRYFCPFGLKNRKQCADLLYNGNEENKATVSEVIRFKDPSNRCKWYGYPSWLAAAPLIDLYKRACQYKSDFYTNRGVLDFILSVMGTIDTDAWDSIVAKIQGTVGGGNNFQNMAINTAENTKVQVDRLAGSDSKEEQFTNDVDKFSVDIVSAHRVPPILANILISGKMGAANETTQALIMLQLTQIAPAQNIFQTALADTLGGPEGVDGLTPESFRLRTITSQFNIQGLDAVSRSREEAVNQPERDFNEGVKD